MRLDSSSYEATNALIWSGRLDSQKSERYFQLIKIIDLTKEQINPKYKLAILGFCSDDGIKRNQGRIGASKGPNAIRRSLANLCIQKNKPQYILDLGNIICKKWELEYMQKILSNIVAKLLKKGIKPLLFGGGHEIAWGHYQGIKIVYPQKKLGIINFDSHFDLRILSESVWSTSGTAFYQIFKDNELNFNYQVIGLQPTSNTKTLFSTAKKLGVRILLAEHVYSKTKNKLTKYLDYFIKNIDIIYVTFCLDVFGSAFAPGVSAPQPFGLLPNQAMFLLRHILKSKKVICMDIAELSPKFDENKKTANLAAHLAWEFLEHN